MRAAGKVVADAMEAMRRSVRPGVTTGSRAAAERSAYIALVVALASHPGVRWLTPYTRLIASENKLRQDAHARGLGIRTPRTAVKPPISKVVPCLQSPQTKTEILA